MALPRSGIRLDVSPTAEFSRTPLPGRLSGLGRIGLSLLLALLTYGCQQSDAPLPVAEQTPVDLAATQQKAEKGDAAAQAALGDLYANGRGVRQDYKQASVWFLKAAEQGHAAAQNSVGELCEAGQGFTQSYTEAAAWYRKAADQGHAGAQYNLAVLHAFGRGTAVNDVEAAKWYRQAAAQGHALAQFNIGQRYQFARGVDRDLVEAFKWLSLAAKSIPDSATLLQELQASMTRDQIAEGRRRVAAASGAQ